MLNPASPACTANDFEIVQLGWQPPAPPPSKPRNVRVVEFANLHFARPRHSRTESPSQRRDHSLFSTSAG